MHKDAEPVASDYMALFAELIQRIVLGTAITMFAALRFGMLALAGSLFTASILTFGFSITLDLSKWYAPQSLFLLATLLAMLFYGLRVATGNKPALADDGAL